MAVLPRNDDPSKNWFAVHQEIAIDVLYGPTPDEWEPG
jgi:hypothetical protein